MFIACIGHDETDFCETQSHVIHILDRLASNGINMHAPQAIHFNTRNTFGIVVVKIILAKVVVTRSQYARASYVKIILAEVLLILVATW